ncbi:hypothetical protein IT084_01745 [Desulfallas sp. Bu1-1]|nr:hypothetical protein [Desulfallas sp. Bu1-1]MBF7081705.1 hypothetical protein [Desulfallas sp. Bu1-1]
MRPAGTLADMHGTREEGMHGTIKAAHDQARPGSLTYQLDLVMCGILF